MLHLVFSSPYSHAALGDCLQQASANDAVILLQDAVTAAIQGSDWAQQLIDSTASVWVLEEDLLARGLSEKRHPAIQSARWEDVVSLSAAHSTSHSWLA